MIDALLERQWQGKLPGRETTRQGQAEDTERSDVDIVIDSLNKELVDLSKFEKILKRRIHLLILPSLSEVRSNSMRTVKRWLEPNSLPH